MRNKNLLKFIGLTIVSFFLFEGLEIILEKTIGLDLHNLEIGWFTFVVIYGFKFHILCCILPMIWAAYKCRHNSCEHSHCHKENKPQNESK